MNGKRDESNQLHWACGPQTGEWRLEDVLETFCRDYEGEIVTVTLSVTFTSPDGEIQATSNHPFWVVSGDDLGSRSGPAGLPESDRVLTARGRWVETRYLRYTIRLRRPNRRAADSKGGQHPDRRQPR